MTLIFCASTLMVGLTAAYPTLRAKRAEGDEWRSQVTRLLPIVSTSGFQPPPRQCPQTLAGVVDRPIDRHPGGLAQSFLLGKHAAATLY